MEEFKIEHFERENEGISFPRYESLSSQQNEHIRVRVCQSFGLPHGTLGAFLTSTIAELQVNCPGVNAEDEDFDLRTLVDSIGVNVADVVFINWNQFDEIDELMFKDLSSHFSDIWYPASDDIDIFDESLSWVISVAYDGSIRFLQIKQ